MKRIICGLLLLALLGTTACSVEIPAVPAAGGAEIPATTAAGGTEIPDGRWLNPDIIGNVTEDTPAELKDNFALYVNKDWILDTTLPDSVASLTTLGELE